MMDNATGVFALIASVRSTAEIITDMESKIHDIRDLTLAVEFITAEAGARQRDIPARIGISLSTIASEVLAKVEDLHADWATLFQRVTDQVAET